MLYLEFKNTTLKMARASLTSYEMDWAAAR